MNKGSMTRWKTLLGILLFLGVIACVTEVLMSCNQYGTEQEEMLQSGMESEGTMSEEAARRQAAASVDPDPKTVYLTFDDGPSYLTSQVLDVLDQYGVKATFFVTYQPDYADMYKEIVARGHVIGVHSTTHVYNDIYASYESWLQDFTQIYNYIYGQIGIYPSVYRFPGGSYGNSCKSHPEVMEQAIAYLGSLGMEYFDWNVSSGDGGYVTAYQVYRNVTDNIQNRHLPIILMHDGAKKENTLAALPDVLKQLKEWGYTFETLSPEVLPIHQGITWDY